MTVLLFACLFVYFCLPFLLPFFVLYFFLLQVFFHCPSCGYAGHNLDTCNLEYTNTDANVQWPVSVVHSLVPKVIAMWMCIWCTKLWVRQCPFVHKSGCVQTQALLTCSSVATENLQFTVHHSLLWGNSWVINSACNFVDILCETRQVQMFGTDRTIKLSWTRLYFFSFFMGLEFAWNSSPNVNEVNTVCYKIHQLHILVCQIVLPYYQISVARIQCLL